ncbi:MAG: uracil-DNA glycosylase, partial [Candidatus Bathyarchaeia archaeon]
SLWKTRKNAVAGEGNPETKIMFVGEAPGYWEDIKGKPFVGAAGKLLDSLLAEIGFKRENVFIANVLKCRPPGNRDPQPSEIHKCTPYLDRQIATIKPRIIVTLGKHSTSYIFAKAGLPFEGISYARGKFYQVDFLGFSTIVFPTFHPAAALYNAGFKTKIINDFKILKNKIFEIDAFTI